MEQSNISFKEFVAIAMFVRLAEKNNSDYKAAQIWATRIVHGVLDQIEITPRSQGE